MSLEEIEELQKQTYKKLIKKRIKEWAFDNLLEKQNRRNGK